MGSFCEIEGLVTFGTRQEWVTLWEGESITTAGQKLESFCDHATIVHRLIVRPGALGTL